LRVLGIDPGSLNTGWGVLTGSPANPEVVECGLVRLEPLPTLPERLACLQNALREVVERLQPTAAAVEAPFHGASARSALQLAHARGAILAVLGDAGLSVAEYAPAAIKKAVTGDGRAEKSRISAMVVQLLGAGVQGERHDVHDALAVALCHLSTATFMKAVRHSSRR
jgi:crossover junction endodeoxyribonuclease RuvC